MWPTDYGFESGLQAAQASLNKLGTDYLGTSIPLSLIIKVYYNPLKIYFKLDLYMMHWPMCPSSQSSRIRETLDDTWRALERLLDAGKCRAIGVSNFSVQELEELMEHCSVVPHVSDYYSNAP